MLGDQTLSAETIPSGLRCPCLDAIEPVPRQELLATFEALRSACIALRDILVPDGLWDAFKAWHLTGDADAHHSSILMLSLMRGHLAPLTKPIHDFLIHAGAPRIDLKRQYAEDLQERWMLHSDPMVRHHRGRMFTGRLMELQCAQWLAEQGWSITGLEAFRDGPDIEATCGDTGSIGFEVKYIGTADDDFGAVLENLRGKPGICHPSPYTAANYLLFRAFEAAKQLAKFNGRRVAVLVIDELAWRDFGLQLEEGWIEWKRPAFLHTEPPDPDWACFIERQQPRYPDLSSQLHSALADIELWIVQRDYGFKYHREYAINPS